MSYTPPEKIARLIKRWNDNPDLTMKQVAESVGMAYGTAHDHIEKAIARGEARPVLAYAHPSNRKRPVRGGGQ